MQNACNMHENLTGLPSGKMETNKQRGRESESTSKRGGEREREIESLYDSPYLPVRRIPNVGEASITSITCSEIPSYNVEQGNLRLCSCDFDIKLFKSRPKEELA